MYQCFNTLYLGLLMTTTVTSTTITDDFLTEY